jgi:hypothetical protein
MNKIFEQPISKKELQKVTNVMAKCKAFGLDGVIMQFHSKFLYLMCQNTIGWSWSPLRKVAYPKGL